MIGDIGAYLAEFDLHTYVNHVKRIPRPSKARIADIQRVDNVFLFDEHYELARSHWQRLQSHGMHVLPMLEALPCQPSHFNNGEDNDAYKTLFCTLLACPGKEQPSSFKQTCSTH